MISEVEREDGDVEHTYGRSPHESGEGDTHDIVSVVKKRKVGYSGRSSTMEHASGTGRQTIASLSIKNLARHLKASRHSQRPRVASTGGSESRSRLERAFSRKDTTASPARKVTADRSRNTRSTSRSNRRHRLLHLTNQAHLPTAATAKETRLRSSQAPISLGATIPTTSGLLQSGAASSVSASTRLSMEHLPVTGSSMHSKAATPDDSDRRKPTESVFQQPGMSRRQSNTFVFDAPPHEMNL